MARNDCHSGGMAKIHHCIGNDWIEIWTDKWCTEGEELTEERMEANAMLMLAAPNLFDDLVLAAETLRRYEVLHRAKGTDESTAKAEVNAELASRFESTIAKARGDQ